MSKQLPLIDGDIICYRVGFAAQNDPVEYCLHSVKLSMQSILEKFQTDEYKLYLQGPGNYREHVAVTQPYKGNRDPNAKPKWYNEIRDYLVEWWNAELVAGRETDDALGCYQYAHKDKSTCIVTIDKDLDCIPGWHYNYVKGEMYYVDLPTANKKFWTQVLTGDTTDNIRGIPKVGPVSAGKIIGATDESWIGMAGAVRQSYINKFGESEGLKQFHENASLIWIQRKEWQNYDGGRLDGYKEKSSQEDYHEEGEEDLTVEGQEQDTAV